MRTFTLLLFFLTVIAGCLAYYGVGALTETMKLAYAYLLLSTMACGVIGFSMRPSLSRPVSGRLENYTELR